MVRGEGGGGGVGLLQWFDTEKLAQRVKRVGSPRAMPNTASIQKPRNLYWVKLCVVTISFCFEKANKKNV